MFKGTGTALITPFNDDGIDYDSLTLLIEDQIKNNIDALIICGTTSEPATMTDEEKNQLIEFCIKKIAGRVPTIVGTGSNCTAKAIKNSIFAQSKGADALLIVTPYYNKCTQEGLFQHYKMINDSVQIPIIAYNVPGRTGVNLLPETAKRLATLDNIRGIKEACGDLEQIKQLAEAIKGSNICLYSGDDNLVLDIIKIGGCGLISVASNLIPKVMHDITNSALSGDMNYAENLNQTYQELFRALFLEVNPIPIKHACSMVGFCKDILRMPLTTMSAPKAKLLEDIMHQLNII